jgi:nitroreductase
MNNKEISEKVLNSLNWRYATKIFDKNKKVAEEDIETILESGRLSPSSLGLEPWKFFVVKDEATRAKLFEASKQPKVTDASHLVVLTYKTDALSLIKERLERTAKIQNQKVEDLENYKKFLEGAISPQMNNGNLESWLKAQSYIALGIMVYTASMLGVDNCPMEGFSNEKVDEILGLKEKGLKSVTMLALGYRGEDEASQKPKIRRDWDEAIETV